MVAYLFFANNGFIKYGKLLKMRDGYLKEIQVLDKEIGQLEEEIELMKKDKNYMEFIIRKELNMKKSEEDLYIIKKK